jgi:RNA polymerase sigma factor (sigma-70 family)
VTLSREEKVKVLEQFIRSNWKSLRAYAKTHIGEALAATVSDEDIVQSAAQKAFINIDHISIGGDDSGLLGWFILGINRAIAEAARKNLGTARITHKGLQRLNSDFGNATPTSSSGPARKAEMAATRQRIQELRCQLPEGWREPVELYYFQEMSIAQVAAKTGQTKDATMKVLERARKLLREWMGNSSKWPLPSRKRLR